MNEARLKQLLEWEAQQPQDAFLKFALSQEYLSAGNYFEAQKYLEHLLEYFTSYLPTYYQLGKLYEQTGEIGKAIEVYQKGVALAQVNGDNKTMRELNNALQQLNYE